MTIRSFCLTIYIALVCVAIWLGIATEDTVSYIVACVGVVIFGLLTALVYIE